MSVIDLDAAASQTGFAKLLGVSQQAVSKQVQKGTLSEDGTYGQWLQEYYQHLSDQAAGRGGENQVDVARATVEEKTVKTALMRLQYQEKQESLIVKEEAFELLADWARFANRQYREGIERLVLAINSQCGVEVPVEVMEKHVGAAIDRVRGYALKLGTSGDDGGGSVSSTEGGADN